MSLHLYAYCGYNNKKVYTYLKPSALKRECGKIFKEIIKEENLKIKEEYMGGAALQESIGAGFLGNHRLNIRMETHIFSERTNNKYTNYIRRQGTRRQYRKTADTDWQTIDSDNQNQNYQAFRIAKGLNEKGGYESISMGMFQIMGFNYEPAGYESAKEMFTDYKKGVREQILSYAKFLQKYSGGKLLKALQRGKIADYAKIYNGGDPNYGSELRDKVKSYKNA